ncbi:gas vesicle protein GvpL/GvpF [Kribbella sp. VKM Ac-2571]|uniref:GvpL/GvpF family gas vesicle protein n=1 Tax=Kribbella sp. VKM Ac-2571 TaxID=2512222 RepID=UPI00106072F7|nr:GvpL/GvpF family gas vesicle protein [Kribbella sp. VKM Ac-2571]TDO66537.1 gas vesicle protein GvpL/GvpF [Kribbella sp. VKM Ac-2571]
MVSESGTYVYAVGRNLDEEVLSGLEGVGGSSVRMISHRELTAVVSTVDLEEFGEDALRRNLEVLAWVEETARRHDEVVRRAAAITTALAPFRLVTIYRSDDAACDRIEELYDDLVLVLDRVDRRSEWSIKVFCRVRSVPSATVEAASSGVAYLERRRAEIRDRQQAAGEQQMLADQLFWDLVPGAAATRRLPPQDQKLTGRREPMALNASFLVDDDHSTDFFELVNATRARYPSLDIEVNGPWPPYSFAVLDKP